MILRSIVYRFNRPEARRRVAVYAFVAIVAGLMAWTIAGGLRARSAANELVALSDEIFATGENGEIDADRLERIAAAIKEADSELRGLGAWILPYRIAGPVMRIVPSRGGDASEMADLVDYAIDLVNAAEPISDLAADLTVDGLPSSISDLDAILDTFEASDGLIEAAEEAVAVAAKQRTEIDHGRLSGDVRSRIETADRLFETLEAAVTLAATVRKSVEYVQVIRSEGGALIDLADGSGVSAALSLGTDLLESEDAIAAASKEVISLVRGVRSEIEVVQPLVPITMAEVDQWLEFGSELIDDVDGIAKSLQAVQELAGAGFAEDPEEAVQLGIEITGLIDRSKSLEVLVSEPPELRGLPEIPERVPELIKDLGVAGAYLQEFLGFNGPRVHLVLAQDEEELRPSGGFLGAVWQLNMENGRLVSREFTSSYDVDGALGPRSWGSAPETFTLGLGSQVIPFRDLNWYVDFPFAAERLRKSYTTHVKVRPSTIVTINQSVMAKVIDGIGPIEVGEGAQKQALDGEAARDYLRAGVTMTGQDIPATWDEQRYASFLLGNALLESLTGGGSANPGALVQALVEAANSGEMRISTRNIDSVQLFRKLGWDGGLTQYEHDGFYVVESSAYAPKISHLIGRSFDYTTILDASGTAFATLDLEYENPVSGIGEDCRQAPQAEGESCYWMISRVLIPTAAEVTSLPDLPAPSGSIASTVERTPANTARTFAGADDLPFRVQEISGLTVVEPKNSTKIGMSYQLPNAAIQGTDGVWRYDLKVRRQPGTGSPRVNVTVELPGGFCIVGSEPDLSVSHSGFHYSFDLNSDKVITIWYGTDEQVCSDQAAQTD
ncbi:MAG: DUF4012 domain-containing protein [Chloroflexi bacterium]|nr:DUF4012 domain-containing protein [Chloroflexota bacterium]